VPKATGDESGGNESGGAVKSCSPLEAGASAYFLQLFKNAF